LLAKEISSLPFPTAQKSIFSYLWGRSLFFFFLLCRSSIRCCFCSLGYIIIVVVVVVVVVVDIVIAVLPIERMLICPFSTAPPFLDRMARHHHHPSLPVGTLTRSQVLKPHPFLSPSTSAGEKSAMEIY